MSILGVVLRLRPQDLSSVSERLASLPGVELTHRAEEGRLVLVMEDCEQTSAAAQLGAIALWPEILGTSLVYEYSGPDAPAPATHHEPEQGWRTRLSTLDTPKP